MASYLTVRPGDVLVLQCSVDASPQAIDFLRSELIARLDAAGARPADVIVLGGIEDLILLHPEVDEKPADGRRSPTGFAPASGG